MKRKFYQRILNAGIFLALGVYLGFLLAKPPAEKNPKVLPSASSNPVPILAIRPEVKVQSRIEPAGLARLTEILQHGEPIEVADCFTALRALKANEFKSAVEMIRRRVNARNDREILLDALAKLWAEQDPQEEFNAALRENDNDIMRRLGFAASARLATDNPESALAILSQARRSQRAMVAEWILPAIARTAPAKSADFLNAHKEFWRDEGLFRQVASEYGRSAPEQALLWADSLPQTRLKEGMTKVVWQVYAEHQPELVASILAAKPGSKLDDNLYGVIGRSWSRKDPSAALKWIQTLQNQQVQERAFSAFDAWDQIEPDKALQVVQGAASDRLKEEIVLRVGTQLARQDFEQALEWNQKLPDGKAKVRGLEPIIDNWSRSEPEAAAQYVLSLPQTPERTALLQRALSRWTQDDPSAAFQWAQVLPEGTDRDNAVAEAVRAVREEEPKKAMEWLALVNDPQVKNRLAGDLVSSLLRIDPAAAKQLAQNLPEAAQPDTFHRLIREWGLQNTAEAGEWINELPHGPARDSAVRAYVTVIDGMNTELATKWAQAIDSPTERTEATFNALERWIQSDPDKARTWVQNNPLPEGLQPFIEKMFKETEQRKARKEQ